MPDQVHARPATYPPSLAPDCASGIPWWRDLTPAARTELDLTPLAYLPAERFDLTIIGAGIAGISAALCASQLGARVLVLEKEAYIGAGATGRNAGILSAGINMSIAELPQESREAAFWPETTRLLLSLVEEAARPDSLLQARLTGALCLAESTYASRRLMREARARIALGLRAETWTVDQVADATGGRLDLRSVVSALWLPDEGRVHPLSLLAHLARQVRASGGILLGDAHVVDYQERFTDGQSSWQLTLATGQQVRTRAFIEASGPTVQANARIYALAFALELPESFPLFWDAAPYTYADFRAGEGRLTISGGRYGRAGVTKRDAFYHRRLADAARRWLPELAHAEPSALWAVDLAVTADMVPQLYPLGKHSSGIAVRGLGALGVLPGMLLGSQAACTLVQRMA